LRSPKSEGSIIATSGEQLDEVVENTGRTEFWRSTTIKVKQTIEKRMSRTIEQNG
jgi:hypothetical protein